MPLSRRRPRYRPAPLPPSAAGRLSQRGFTAIEIAMVATVIAIFALLVLPLFRNRVDEAKKAAVRADLTSLMKAEILAQADTGFYLRLEDLDNITGLGLDYRTSGGTAPPAAGITLEIPFFYYRNAPIANTRGVLDDQSRLSFAGSASDPKFKGPYATFARFALYSELRSGNVTQYANMFMRGGGQGNPLRSAIQDFPTGTFHDADDNHYPIDPWGNPYLFFPPSSETPYLNSVIYSLGPDGLPGSTVNPAAGDFLRPGDPLNNNTTNPNRLGQGDDYEVQF